MSIWIDADGCPRKVVEITRLFANQRKIPCWTVSNFHHEFAGRMHILVDDTSQSVDMTILNRCKPGDLVITQDIGLAALVMGKKCYALGVYGQEYKKENIAFLLEMREQSAKFRRAGGRSKGPKRRTKEDDEAFAQGLEKMFQKIDI